MARYRNHCSYSVSQLSVVSGQWSARAGRIGLCDQRASMSSGLVGEGSLARRGTCFAQRCLGTGRRLLAALADLHRFGRGDAMLFIGASELVGDRSEVAMLR